MDDTITIYPVSPEKQIKKVSILYQIALTVSKSLDLKIILDDVPGMVIRSLWQEQNHPQGGNE